MKLVEIEQTTGEIIYVNPRLVTAVWAVGNDANFNVSGSEQTKLITAKGPVKEVIRRLNRGLRA